MGVRMSPCIPAPMYPYYQCAHVPVSHGPPELEPIVKVQHNTEGKLTEERVELIFFQPVLQPFLLLLSKMSKNCVSLDFKFVWIWLHCWVEIVRPGRAAVELYMHQQIVFWPNTLFPLPPDAQLLLFVQNHSKPKCSSFAMHFGWIQFAQIIRKPG